MIVQQTMTVVRLLRISLRSPSLGVKARNNNFKVLHFYMDELSFIIEKLERFIRLNKKPNKIVIYFRILKSECVYIIHKEYNIFGIFKTIIIDLIVKP